MPNVHTRQVTVGEAGGVPRIGSAGSLMELTQGRWASGSGLTHTVGGDIVVCDQTGAKQQFEHPTGNLLLLMGVAVKPGSVTPDRIEWADGDVWARIQPEVPVEVVVDTESVSPWRRHRMGSGKAIGIGWGFAGTGWLGAADNNSIIGQEKTIEYMRHGLAVDRHRQRVRGDCREWETDTSPLRNRPSNHPHIERQLGIVPVSRIPSPRYRLPGGAGGVVGAGGGSGAGGAGGFTVSGGGATTTVNAGTVTTTAAAAGASTNITTSAGASGPAVAVSPRSNIPITPLYPASPLPVPVLHRGIPPVSTRGDIKVTINSS